MQRLRWCVVRLLAASEIMLAMAGMTPRAARSQPTPQGAPAAGTAKLIGTITDTAGVPLARAEIWLLAVAALRTISNDTGAFELTGLPAGPVTFAIRRLGYESATFSSTLKEGKTHRATFPLTPAPQALAGVRVQDTTSAWLSLFESRRAGHRGTFITRADFEKKQHRMASDILRMVPGVQVVPTRFGTQIVMSRGAGARRCVPQLYVHTTPYSGNFDDFTPEDIEALEVYVGVSEIPPDLNTMGRPVCAAIVIWTREPPPRKR
jgi:hypothetical protein